VSRHQWNFGKDGTVGKGEFGEGLAGLVATGAVLGLVFFAYPLLLDLPLIDPDEGLLAAVAQEMVEGGDWLTPRFLGEPFLDKAIFYCWTQALSLEALGMTPAAVRLPGMLFAILGVVTTGLVGASVFNSKVGVVAALAYATMIVPTALAQCPAPDVVLVPLVSLAILLFWEADRAATGRRAAGCTLAIGVLLGLACLTKGLVPAALVGAAYGSYLLVARRFTLAACLRGASALLVAGLVASPWYLAAESRNPGFLYYFFVERHVLGYATNTQRHGDEPFWYYLPILVGGGLPWIAYLPAGLRDWWARRNAAEPDARPASNGGLALVLSWLIACTLLLSLAGSKLITYIWPVFPALAILAAVVWVRLLDERLAAPARRWFSVSFWALCLGGLPVLPLTMLAVGSALRVQFSWSVWAVGAATACLLCVPLALWSRQRFRSALIAATLVIAGQFVFIMTVIAPHAAGVNSARDLAEHFNRLDDVPPQVVLVEERVGSLVFYLERHLRARLRPGQLESVSARRMAELSQRGPDAVIALADDRVKKACRYVDLAGVEFQQAGRYRLYSPEQLRRLRFKPGHAARRLSSTVGAESESPPSFCCGSSAGGGGCSWRVRKRCSNRSNGDAIRLFFNSDMDTQRPMAAPQSVSLR